jgi:hypothetical protein
VIHQVPWVGKYARSPALALVIGGVRIHEGKHDSRVDEMPRGTHDYYDHTAVFTPNGNAMLALEPT